MFFQKLLFALCIFSQKLRFWIILALFLLDQKKGEKKSRLKIKSYIKPSFAKTKELLTTPLARLVKQLLFFNAHSVFLLYAFYLMPFQNQLFKVSSEAERRSNC